MPPKARFTKQMIEDAAFELAKQRGIEAVAAREVAKALNMTVTPIFGSFTNMSELRQTVYERAKAEFQAYLRGCLDYTPSFQAYCLRWVCYAAENQNLYRFLMQRMWTSGDKRGVLPELEAPLLAELTELFSLSHEAASELVAHMLIYSGGLCTLLQQGEYAPFGGGHLSQAQPAVRQSGRGRESGRRYPERRRCRTAVPRRRNKAETRITKAGAAGILSRRLLFLFLFPFFCAIIWKKVNWGGKIMETRKKVLHFLPRNSFSGAENVADCIAKDFPPDAFGDIGPSLGRAIRESKLCKPGYRLGTQTIRATVIGATPPPSPAARSSAGMWPCPCKTCERSASPPGSRQHYRPICRKSCGRQKGRPLWPCPGFPPPATPRSAPWQKRCWRPSPRDRCLSAWRRTRPRLWGRPWPAGQSGPSSALTESNRPGTAFWTSAPRQGRPTRWW